MFAGIFCARVLYINLSTAAGTSWKPVLCMRICSTQYILSLFPYHTVSVVLFPFLYCLNSLMFILLFFVITIMWSATIQCPMNWSQTGIFLYYEYQSYEIQTGALPGTFWLKSSDVLIVDLEIRISCPSYLPSVICSISSNLARSYCTLSCWMCGLIIAINVFARSSFRTSNVSRIARKMSTWKNYEGLLTHLRIHVQLSTISSNGYLYSLTAYFFFFKVGS